VRNTGPKKVQIDDKEKTVSDQKTKQGGTRGLRPSVQEMKRKKKGPEGGAAMSKWVQGGKVRSRGGERCCQKGKSVQSKIGGGQSFHNTTNFGNVEQVKKGAQTARTSGEAEARTRVVKK